MATSNARILALDVGSQRVGVASASPIARLATALPTLDMDEAFFSRLQSVIEQEGADTIVVGIPIGMNRQATSQTAFVYNFIRELTAACPTMNITTYEETLTSKQAEDELAARRKPYAKGDIDARAAELILQGYLDSNSHIRQEVQHG